MTRSNAVNREILQGDAYENFRAAVRSEATLDPYQRRLIHFLNNIKMTPDEFVAAARKDSAIAEKAVIKYIAEVKGRVDKEELSGGTLAGSLKPVRLLLEMNDVVINWKKIRRMLPRVRRYAIDRIPSDEELRVIVNAADVRGKALTLCMASGGIREGAIETFQIGDYTKIQREGNTIAGRLLVYREDPEQYVTFISCEACEHLDRYLKFREDNGEMLKPGAPLFREKFDPIAGRYKNKDAASASNPTPMNGASVRKYYNRLLHSIGIRTERKRRHEFSVHGLRKWFKTRAELGGMKPINVETLMGHSTGISDSYYRPTEKELLEDYIKAIDALSILTETRIKKDLEVAMQDRIEAAVERKVQEIMGRVDISKLIQK